MVEFSSVGVTSIRATAGQYTARATAQRAPALTTVQAASAPIMQGIVQQRGDTVGTLEPQSGGRASLGGLEGAGLFTGTGIMA